MAGSSGAKLNVCDVYVQRIMLAHEEDERTFQVDTHLPIYPSWAASWGNVGESMIRGLGEFPSPDIEMRLSRRTRQLVKRMHPFGQIVEVLTIAVPLQPLVEGLVGAALGELFADPKPATGRMILPLALAQPADPSLARVVATMSSQCVMYAANQAHSQICVPLFPSRTRQAEKVANREGVCPQVALLRTFRTQPGAFRKAGHQLDSLS
jgi:hypothetical protein